MNHKRPGLETYVAKFVSDGVADVEDGAVIAYVGVVAVGTAEAGEGGVDLGGEELHSCRKLVGRAAPGDGHADGQDGVHYLHDDA